jgi:hypothetical protein
MISFTHVTHRFSVKPRTKRHYPTPCEAWREYKSIAGRKLRLSPCTRLYTFRSCKARDCSAPVRLSQKPFKTSLQTSDRKFTAKYAEMEAQSTQSIGAFCEYLAVKNKIRLLRQPHCPQINLGGGLRCFLCVFALSCLRTFFARVNSTLKKELTPKKVNSWSK